MGTGVMVGDLMAVADVGDLWGEADERRKPKAGKREKRRRGDGTGAKCLGVSDSGVRGSGIHGPGVHGPGVDGSGVGGSAVDGSGVGGSAVDGSEVDGSEVNGSGAAVKIVRQEWAQWGSAAKRITAKRLGEMAEAVFLAKASGMGFGVAKPWGDSEPYDFILAVRGRLLKVQVKAAFTAGQGGCYSFCTHDHALRPYSAKDFDALVAYVAPENAWYVLPMRLVRRLRALKLFPASRRKRSKFERYREAWWVLRGE